MHLQVKVKPGGAIFSDDDVSELITNSADYERGSFRHILQVLAEADFNIRGASGHRIEFGGEFTFWVSKRDGDADHEAATEAAAQTLIGAGLDARVVSVSVSLLNDEPGALRDFVARIQDDGLWVEEITVGTPDSDGRVPVQIYTSRTK